MVAVVQPGVAARSGDVVVATIDGASDHAVHVEHVLLPKPRAVLVCHKGPVHILLHHDQIR